MVLGLSEIVVLLILMSEKILLTGWILSKIGLGSVIFGINIMDLLIAIINKERVSKIK